MDLVAAINNESGALFEQETDSLINLYTPDTVAGIGYKTQLSPKFYGSASYHLGKHHTFGAMMYADVFKGALKPAFGLSYNLQLGHIWTIGVNGSYRNKSFKNLGLGTTLTLGAFQIYAITENITALSGLSDARFIDLRFGMNLVFGKLEKDKKSFAKKEKEEVPAIILTDPLNTNAVLTETVVSGVAGNTKDELPSGFYIVIATFSSQDEATSYSKQLQFEGYAASFGYQSELDKYYIYLMYFSADGNKAIEKKNALKESLAPGLEIPWVLWVKDQD